MHLWLDDFIEPFAPRGAPGWWVIFTLAVFVGGTVAIVAWLNRRGLFLRM